MAKKVIDLQFSIRLEPEDLENLKKYYNLKNADPYLIQKILKAYITGHIDNITR